MPVSYSATFGVLTCFVSHCMYMLVHVASVPGLPRLPLSSVSQRDYVDKYAVNMLTLPNSYLHVFHLTDLFFLLGGCLLCILPLFSLSSVSYWQEHETSKQPYFQYHTLYNLEPGNFKLRNLIGQCVGSLFRRSRKLFHIDPANSLIWRILL